MTSSRCDSASATPAETAARNTRALSPRSSTHSTCQGYLTVQLLPVVLKPQVLDVFSELVESVVVEPGDVVVIEMESDELVKWSESSAWYTGHLVSRHGEGL